MTIYRSVIFSTFLALLANTGVCDSTDHASSHAPIGVMGDHTHKKGEVMFSYRRMQMSMSGNLQGSDNISDDSLVTNVTNRFAGMPGMPPTLRIVPQDMETTMDMFGLMYAPSNSVTLMLMTHYVDKEMTLKTYQGPTSLNVRGEFTTASSGWGDTKIAALISTRKSSSHKVHFNLGLNLPTGALDNRDRILTPMGGTPEVRLPYAMQLGSGTYDIEPGITYNNYGSTVSWGAQARSVIRLGENDEGYTLGDQYYLSGWAQYSLSRAASVALRLSGKTVAEIDGADANIMGPVQTADPSNYGGDFINLSFGINLLGQQGWVNKHRLAFEYTVPLMQDVNGVQMEMDTMWTLGYQYAL